MSETENNQPVHPARQARIQALAEVSRMDETIATLHDKVAQLERDLGRAEDRVSLLVEERDRYRRDAFVYRDKLVELATAQANIGLLTVKAGEIMAVVADLTKDAPQTQDRAAIVDKLHKAMTESAGT